VLIRSKLKTITRAATVLLLVLAAASCAPDAAIRPPAPPGAEGVDRPEAKADKGWWRVRFRMRWPENTEPLWHMDLFVAREVVAPALRRYERDIELWRFHRRAARDDAGHQFSFLFYARPRTAEQVLSFVRSSRELDRMRSEEKIVEVLYDATTEIKRPQVRDTSDSRWPPEVQKTWPYFIMGVSEMWLRLVDEYAREECPAESSSSPEDRDDCYREVAERMETTWREQGRHALLHHLNALYGYEPLVYYEKRLLRF
jgi:hypothetical protein